MGIVKANMKFGIILIMLLTLFYGCAAMEGLFSVPDETKTPEGAYYMARKTLNDYWEIYLNYRNAMPNGPKKQALKNKFDDTGTDSIFTRADKVLDSWREVLNTPEAYQKEKLFDLILDEIISQLIIEDLIKIEIDVG